MGIMTTTTITMMRIELNLLSLQRNPTQTDNHTTQHLLRQTHTHTHTFLYSGACRIHCSSQIGFPGRFCCFENPGVTERKESCTQNCVKRHRLGIFASPLVSMKISNSFSRNDRCWFLVRIIYTKSIFRKPQSVLFFEKNMVY